nr:undecaprenyl-diphosphatase UppP [bacterium]
MTERSMELFQAFILGMVQGLGEFLPISSSAHLILAPWFFGWEDQGLAFDVALHWGTLLAVVVYFRKDIVKLIKGFLSSLFPRTRDLKDPHQKLAWLIFIATIPAVIIGKLFEHQVETVFRNPLLIAGTLSVMGILLLVADKYGEKMKTIPSLKWVNALLIGFAQAAAIVPGFSRSGSTITAGLFSGLTRHDATRFSFLMAIPITLGAGLLKIPDIVNIENHTEVFVGFITSAIFGFLSIKFLLK